MTVSGRDGAPDGALPRGAAVDLRKLVSVSDANTRGMSRLIADLRSGGDVIVVRNSRAEAALISVEKYEQLQQLEHAEACATYVLAFARYLTEHADALPLIEAVEPSLRAYCKAPDSRRAIAIVPSVRRQMQEASAHERAMLVTALVQVTYDPFIGTLYGPNRSPEIRALNFGGWQIAYATSSSWSHCYVLDLARRVDRDCFKKMQEATDLLGQSLGNYASGHVENDGTPRRFERRRESEPSHRDATIGGGNGVKPLADSDTYAVIMLDVPGPLPAVLEEMSVLPQRSGLLEDDHIAT